MEGDYKIEMFKEGTHQLNPIRFSKDDKKDFIIEFDWARECITPDWSVTVWAEYGEVIVMHSDGLVSDSLPTLDDFEIEYDQDIHLIDNQAKEFNSNNGNQLTTVRDYNQNYNNYQDVTK